MTEDQVSPAGLMNHKLTVVLPGTDTTGVTLQTTVRSH